jgi:hypothetical protein
MRSGEVVVSWWWYPPIRHRVPLPRYHELPRRLDQKVEWVKKSFIKKIERRLELERRKRTFLEGGLRARRRGARGIVVVVLGVGSADTTEPLRAQQWGATGRDQVSRRGDQCRPTQCRLRCRPSSSSVIYAFFHSLHSPVRGAPCHPSRDMPLLSSLPLSRQWSRREREPLMDFGADRPTAPLDGRPLPPYSPPLDTECDRMRMGRFATESHTLAALGILERPILCKHLRLRDGGFAKAPQLALRRELKSECVPFWTQPTSPPS